MCLLFLDSTMCSKKSCFHLTAQAIINECGADSGIPQKHILITGATSALVDEAS